MEDKIKLQLQLSSSMEDGFREEELYEEIEAPKFVDFTIPDHYSPDDRYWFCSRVGCDQRHEEEMDSEAIYKNFVLRVMAARSPNVRLRKALTRRAAGETKKCPVSAPPKSSKSRLPRLALASSSISKKLLLDQNPEKPCSTPKARVKHVAAKYMTSVRKKKGSSPNPNGFRSVRNPTRTSITLPKNHNNNKVVAKGLAFISPKKPQKVKPASKDLATPVSKLCDRMKKMQITHKPHKSEKKGQSVHHHGGAKTRDDSSDMDIDGKDGNLDDGDIENKNPDIFGEVTNNHHNKENELNNNNNSDNIRNSNTDNQNKHNKVIKTVDKKSFKENCSAGNQGVKYRKLKPTNPKPFRLRTDERGILKETILERKANSEENATMASENLQCPGNDLPENRAKQSKDMMNKSLKPTTQLKQIKSKYMSTSKVARPKSDKEVPPPCPEKERTKLQSRETTEVKATILKLKAPRKPAVPHKLAAQGRKAATTPKELKFHNLYKPKCCTKNTELSNCIK